MTEKVTPEELLNAINAPLLAVFNEEKLTVRYLVKKLKRELNAKEVKVFKAKILKRLPAKVGLDGKEIEPAQILEVEEVIYSKPLAALEIRQEARKDAQRLLNLYPPERKELSGPDGNPIGVKYYDFDDSKFPPPGGSSAKPIPDWSDPKP